MKQTKKLTRDQKNLLSSKGMEPADWKLIHESKTDIQIINKFNKEIKVIEK
jgi:hypothetical protein